MNGREAAAACAAIGTVCWEVLLDWAVKKAEAMYSTSRSLAFSMAARSSLVASRMDSGEFASTVVAPLTPLVSTRMSPAAAG